MAEAFLRKYAGKHFEAYSAGLEPSVINPYTERVMREVGIDISGQRSKSVKEFLGKMCFTYLITVCAEAEANCPTTFPGISHRLSWALDDPAIVGGSEEEKLQKFREVRDQIENRIKLWIEEQPMEKECVLFLCTGNSDRSQMAEAFLRKYAGEHFEAYSAGLQPSVINPYTEHVMREVGIDISGQRSKSVKEFLGKMRFTYLITVCTEAEANCPTTFPGISHRLSWALDDPAAVGGSEEEKLQKFRDVRGQIEKRIKLWIEEKGISQEHLSEMESIFSQTSDA
jgi:arsenate reductase